MSAMTLQQLIDVCREISDDKKGPNYRVSDSLYMRFANDAVLEHCERALSLYDESSAFCTVSQTAPNAAVTLDASIIAPQWVAWNGVALDQATDQEMDLMALGANWRTATGVPARWLRHQQAVRLQPAPALSGTVTLGVFRRPTVAEEITTLAGTPVIPAHRHMDLTYWMLYRALAEGDPDQRDEKVSLQQLALFEARVGKRRTARADRLAQDAPKWATTPASRLLP